jgi:hypothetical protein
LHVQLLALCFQDQERRVPFLAATLLDSKKYIEIVIAQPDVGLMRWFELEKICKNRDVYWNLLVPCSSPCQTKDIFQVYAFTQFLY